MRRSSNNEPMKKTLSFIWELIKITAIALVIVIPIRYFLFQPFLVKGQSMEPNFKEGDYLIVDEISYRIRAPERGDVIVLNFPQNPSQRLIKRIMGLPGETVEVKDNKVSVCKEDSCQTLNESSYIPNSLQTDGDLKIELKQNEYFVMGDNRPYSFDSRRFGVLPKEDIIGKVFLRAWPFNSFTKITAPNY
jgi:signal peptidase I